MQTISWWDAWALWLSGQEVPSGARMGPFTILAWGRIGKLLSFFAGATVVLDLVDSERLRKWGARTTGVARFFYSSIYGVVSPNAVRAALLVLMGIVLLTYALAVPIEYTSTDPAGVRYLRDLISWIIVVVMAVIVFGVLMNMLILTLIGEALAAEKPGQEMRYTALAVLCIGFHLDLLAS